MGLPGCSNRKMSVVNICQLVESLSLSVISPVPGKISILQCVVSCLTLCDPMGCSRPGFSCLWEFPDKNTGVGCHFLLQSMLLIQGLKLCLLQFLYWQVDSFTSEPPRKLGKFLFVFHKHLCFWPYNFFYLLGPKSKSK